LRRQPALVQPVERANSSQPFQGPRLRLRPSFAHPDEVPPHMGPTESQDEGSLLNPTHRLVSRIPVYHQHPARPGLIVAFADLVTGTDIQHEDDGVRTQEDPYPPTISFLPLQDDEPRPPRLIGLMQVAVPIPPREGLINRPQQDFQPPQAVGDGAR